jgi:hypothetical protein
MKKLLAFLLALAIILPCGMMLTSNAKADMLYIIPDSNTRELTYDELWDYQYDTLMFAFNEIYARHGYKFNTGSRCYNWFTQMPWYHANESESPTNHRETYSQCSKIENANVDLIKRVRRDMKDAGTTNPQGKGMPTPPARNLDNITGFVFLSGMKTGQKFKVFSAPSEASFRAANGKAQVSSNGAIYGMGWENGWLLIMYETNNGQCRIGYINNIRGNIPSLPQLSLSRVSCRVLQNSSLTDDPAKSGNPIATLQEGTTVTYLTTMYNSGAWDYIETTINGQTARGFVPSGILDIDTVDELDEVDANEQMDAEG